MNSELSASRGSADKRPRKNISTELMLLAYLTILHGLMFVYDLTHPHLFLNADRASTRIENIKHFISLPPEHSPILDFVSSNGVPGDYFFQALLFQAGGQFLVIAGQVSLLLVSVLALYRLTLIVTHSRKLSLGAALLYAHLPASLVYAHLLCSEAIFDPLVVLGFYFIVRGYVHESNHGARDAALSGTLFGVAALVRPVVAPWSLFLAPWLLLGKLPYRRVMLYLLMSLLPVVLWMSFVFSQTSKFSMGESFYDLGHNLYGRARTVFATMTTQSRDAAETKLAFLADDGRRVLSLRAYLKLVTMYPKEFLKHTARDGFVYFSKSSLEQLTVHYFHLGGDEASNDADTWRSQADTEGLWVASLRFFKKHPFIVLSSIIAALFLICLWGLFVLGASFVMLNKDKIFDLQQRTGLIALSAFPFFMFFMVALVSISVPSRYRAPTEFAICIIAAVGWYFLRTFRQHALRRRIAAS